MKKLFMGFTRIIRFPKSYSKSRFLNSFCQERFSQNMYLPKQPDWSLGTNLNFCIPEYETVPRSLPGSPRTLAIMGLKIGYG
jgi:hypothetical protein